MLAISPTRSSSSLGALFGLLAAILFGASTPFAKLLLPGFGPLELGGWLYLSAGVALSVFLAIRGVGNEARLSRADLPKLVAVIVFGGVLGPLLLLTGLLRLSALASSLLLNLEAVFTIALAVTFFRESLGRGPAIGAALIVAGACCVGAEAGRFEGDLLGVACVAGACLCWGLDNNLTQRLSLKDPVRVVRVKALGAGASMLAASLLLGHRLSVSTGLAGAAAIGAVSYGLSIVLDVYALRLVGAAREAAYFATAPFAGAVMSIAVLHERPKLLDGLGAFLMIGGVFALLRERHEHTHTHQPLDHEHLHVHDAHHQHAHPGMDSVTEPHSHPHHHDPLTHSHPHVPDEHHRHKH